ncbi:hypothetical protein MSAN_01346400 [Mycena sanguinolenta]|uniref:F-box domain-containing protein n=1 Tax=Mycena sanguinolenta TaxID=230812 RepID=A0A8H6YFT9_9AGAR|nr:hypothetical protein MSAN_01346400 [Mycena sanguinolenta]
MPISVRAILVEQTERTRQSSKADIERFIEESEQKITSLESQIRGLVELRDRERACVDVLRYIISPIRTLPVELLAEIFELAIDDETHVEDTYRISQICSDWRNVAHAAPRLWTRRICVDIGSRSDGRGSFYAAGLDAWLARSAPLPLPVSIKMGPGDSDPRILEHVFRTAPRFRSLHWLEFPLLSIISRLAECRLDSLEELKLGLTESDISRPPALTTVPRLRKSNLIIRSDEPHILVPWAQLTDLTLYCESPKFIRDVLAQCANLTSAFFVTSGWYLGAITPPTSGPSRPQPPAHVFTYFWGLGACSANSRLLTETSLAVFLMQSPKLTELEIFCGPYAPTSHELIVALEQTSHLTHLELVYPDKALLDDALIAALSYKDDVTPLVPHLHSLVLDVIDEDGFATVALEHMFVSRWRTDAQITSSPPAVSCWSYLELRGQYSEQFMESMQMLQRKGLPLALIGL